MKPEDVGVPSDARARMAASRPAAAAGNPRQLKPILDARVAHFLEAEHDRLTALVARWGSPLNIVWPHALLQNVDTIRRTIATHGVDCEIFYGAKVNKSPGLVRAAVDAGVGVDISSLPEFEDALRARVDPARICATGPAKTVALHDALVEAGSLIAIDSLEELDDLQVSIKDRRARILLRYRPSSEAGSRFGMTRDAIVVGLHRIAADARRIRFEGFHAHLASYAVDCRIAAMAELTDLVDAAAAYGLATTMLDLGGGMPIRYVEPGAYAAALRDQGPRDYRDGHVPASFYPYGSDITVADWMDAFLKAPCRGGTIADYLRAADMRLAIEPGRSLVDQAAITVFRVTRVKSLEDGTAVIFVEGSSFSACETWCNSEFLIDPILLPASSDDVGSGAVRAYIAGHSCLGDDVVTNRLIHFAAAPRRGDLLIYANTAGYQMDLLENEFHRHPMPVRLIAIPVASGSVVFVQDK